MGMIFRKSVKLGPFRLTASRRGLSGSLGAGPFRLTKSSRGRRTTTVRVPGSGLSWRRTKH